LGDRPVAAGAPAGSSAATGCIKKQTKDRRKKRTGEVRPP
jgi:hypothetical protein